MKLRTFLFAASAPLAAATVAQATAVIGATEPTQIMNNMELGVSTGAELDQLIQQVAMVKNQIEAYKLMIQNIKDAPLIESDAVTELLGKLHDLTTSGQSFAYAGSNSAEVFEKTHPTYEQTAANGMTATEYQNRYQEWDKGVRESANQTLKALDLDKDDIKDRQALLKKLHALNRSAEGQKAAIQIGNQYAAMLNEQLISLRYLLHLQIQQQQEFAQVEHSESAADQARTVHANAQEAEVKP